MWEVQGYGTVTGAGNTVDGAAPCEIRPPWVDVRLTFANGSRIDVLAVLRDGRIAIEEAQADPPLELDGFAALAGTIDGPLKEACRTLLGRPAGSDHGRTAPGPVSPGPAGPEPAAPGPVGFEPVGPEPGREPVGPERAGPEVVGFESGAREPAPLRPVVGRPVSRPPVGVEWAAVGPAAAAGQDAGGPAVEEPSPCRPAGGAPAHAGAPGGDPAGTGQWPVAPAGDGWPADGPGLTDSGVAAQPAGRHRARPTLARGAAGRRGVAEIYRAAQREDQDPVLAVMSATGLSRRKSLRLIAGARDEGHLTARHHRR